MSALGEQIACKQFYIIRLSLFKSRNTGQNGHFAVRLVYHHLSLAGHESSEQTVE